MKLKAIFNGDFRKNEATLEQEAIKRTKGMSVGPNECVLFVSRGGKMLQFVFGFQKTNVVYANGRKPGVKTATLLSRRARIVGRGGWNPLMIADHAEELGLNLVQLKKFKEHYLAQQEARRHG